MKKLLIYLFVILGISNIYAQNNGFNYKALIIDGGNPLSNHSVDVRFTILESGTVIVYKETQVATTDENGIIILNIGEGTVETGNFSTINWENEQYLQTEINTGNGFTDFGTVLFKYVPLAKYADKAGNTFSGNYNDLTNTPDFSGWDTNVYDDITVLDNLDHVKIQGTNMYLGEEAGLSYPYDEFDSDNTGVGIMSQYNNNSGESNVSLGVSTLFSNVSGDYNIAIGTNALSSNTSGGNNIAIGHNAGLRTTGSGNIFIGYEAGYFETGNNKLYIDNSDTSTPLIGGDFSIDQVTVNGDLKITDKITNDNSGNADLKAYIYGNIDALGNISGATEGFSVSFPGNYNMFRITFDNPPSGEDYVVTANLTSGNIGFIVIKKYNGYFDITTLDKDGNDSGYAFNFVVYKK